MKNSRETTEKTQQNKKMCYLKANLSTISYFATITKREVPYSKHKAINGIEEGSRKSSIHMLNTPDTREHVLSASCSSHG
jgi:hypothetical protein